MSHSYLFINFIYLFLPHLIEFNKTLHRGLKSPSPVSIPFFSRGNNHLEFGVYNSQTRFIIILHLDKTTAFPRDLATYIFFPFKNLLSGLQKSCKTSVDNSYITFTQIPQMSAFPTFALPAPLPLLSSLPAQLSLYIIFPPKPFETELQA